MDTAEEQSSAPPESRLLSAEAIHGVAIHTAIHNELNRASAEGDQPQFRYSRLPPDSFRVLYLHPGSGDDALICSLFVEPLATPLGPFEAVSYVWGIKSPKHKITCNWGIYTVVEEGAPGFTLPRTVTNNFEITPNLRKLLLEIREPVMPRRLWIDQICINQNEDEDKFSQIQHMTQIYHKASRVLIWLENGEIETKETISTIFTTIDFLYVLHDMSLQQRGLFVSLMLIEESGVDQANSTRDDGPEDEAIIYGLPLSFWREKFRGLLVGMKTISRDKDGNPPAFHIDGVQTLTQFLAKTSWFRRAWTFQESIMAREAQVVYGSMSCSWDVLYKACKVITLGGSSVVRDARLSPVLGFSAAESIVRRGRLREERVKLQPLLAPASMAEWARDLTKLGSPQILEDMLKQWRLKRMLPEIRPNDASEDVDKVLALTGFAHDDSRLIELPNHNSQVRELYVTVVKYWMTTPEETLDIQMMGPGAAKKVQRWFEWECPLKHSDPDLSFLSHVGKSKHDLPSWVPDWSCPLEVTPLSSVTGFRACGDWKQPAEINDSKPQAELHLQGVHLMTIKSSNSDPDDFDSLETMIPGFSSKLYPTTTMTYPQVCAHLSRAVDVESIPLPERSASSLGFWQHVEKSIRSAKRRKKAARLVGSLFCRPRVRDVAPVRPTGSKKLQRGSDINLAEGRAFFVSGIDMVGLAPKSSAPHDVVYLIAGLKVPVVLRKRPDNKHFQLIGECYAFGVMGGEALVNLPEDKVEEIVLV